MKRPGVLFSREIDQQNTVSSMTMSYYDIRNNRDSAHSPYTAQLKMALWLLFLLSTLSWAGSTTKNLKRIRFGRDINL